MLGGIEVFVFLMSGQSGKGKEEGVAPSSSGLSETDQEGGVSNSPFPSSHLSSVGASGKLSTDWVREKEEKVRKCLKEILEKLTRGNASGFLVLDSPAGWSRGFLGD